MRDDFIWESTAQGDDAYRVDQRYRPHIWIGNEYAYQNLVGEGLVPNKDMKNVTPPKRVKLPTKESADE